MPGGSFRVLWGHLGVLRRLCGFLGASGVLAGKIREISGGILEGFWKYLL